MAKEEHLEYSTMKSIIDQIYSFEKKNPDFNLAARANAALHIGRRTAVSLRHSNERFSSHILKNQGFEVFVSKNIRGELPGMAA